MVLSLIPLESVHLGGEFGIALLHPVEICGGFRLRADLFQDDVEFLEMISQCSTDLANFLQGEVVLTPFGIVQGQPYIDILRRVSLQYRGTQDGHTIVIMFCAVAPSGGVGIMKKKGNFRCASSATGTSCLSSSIY